MSTRRSERGRARGRRVQHPSGVLTAAAGGRALCAALLGGASLLALSAFALPTGARAACNGPDQTFNMAVAGPANSNGGAITVTNMGTVTGKAGGPFGGTGVLVGPACPATTVTNSAV
jgi:hypothetical protein